MQSIPEHLKNLFRSGTVRTADMLTQRRQSGAVELRKRKGGNYEHMRQQTVLPLHCVAHHRDHDEGVPACFFSKEAEATYDRSIENLARDHGLLK